MKNKTEKKGFRSIRSKILTPFFITIIGMPVIILTAFHIFMNHYIDGRAASEVENIFQTTTALIENQVIEKSDDMENEDAGKVLRELKAVLTAARMTGSTTFYLFNERMNILYPQGRKNEPYMGELRQQLEKNRKDIFAEKVVKLECGEHTFFVSGKPLEFLNGSLRLNIVVVNRQEEFYDLLRRMDTVFFVAALISAALCILFAFYMAYDITKATKTLCGKAKEIGGGNFIQVEPDEVEVREIADLYISLNEMSNRLKQYDETQKNFLQNVSHELRTPLMSIQGYAEGIEYQVFDDVEHAAQIIGDESKRMTAMVEDLLVLSRLETETMHVSMQEYDVNELLFSYVERMKGLTLLNAVEIRVKPENKKIPVYVDEVLLSHAVTNIVGNGVRHAKSEVVLQVTELNDGWNVIPRGSFLSERVTFSREKAVVIRIMDDGNGFEPEDIPYLFERFYKGKGGKYGIGLAIAKTSIEKMGGFIIAFNQDEKTGGKKGACFEIRLPVLIEK